MSSSVAQDPSSRVVTRARIGFRARVTYFELGCPETNIDPNPNQIDIELGCPETNIDPSRL